MAESKTSRVRDPRSLRYTQAKQAAARYLKAVAAERAAGKRREQAFDDLRKVIESAASAEESLYLSSLANLKDGRNET
jgi:hypothetical protein